MSDAARDLDELMRARLQDGGYALAGGRELFMEVIDTTTGLYWMSAAAVTQHDYDSLVVEEPLVKFGCALAAMDSAAFQYSPAAPEAPVLERMIEGRLYINVAKPGEPIPATLPGGPMEIAVDKAHMVGFEAGRSVVILSLPDGDYVELVGDDSADESLVLPQGGLLRRIELSQPWVVSLPTPTRTFFWFGENMRSFQGPVALPGSD